MSSHLNGVKPFPGHDHVVFRLLSERVQSVLDKSSTPLTQSSSVPSSLLALLFGESLALIPMAESNLDRVFAQRLCRIESKITV